MVYFVVQNNNQVKIGFSNNIKQRIKTISTSSPFPIILLGYQEGTKADEKKLHFRFRQYHMQREWFQLSEEILDYINQNTITDTYCDFDDSGILRVYKKMKI